MQFKKIITFAVFISLLYNCKRTETPVLLTQIIPVPEIQSVEVGQFFLNNATGISFEEGFKVSEAFLKSFVKAGSNINLKDNNAMLFPK